MLPHLVHASDRQRKASHGPAVEVAYSSAEEEAEGEDGRDSRAQQPRMRAGSLGERRGEDAEGDAEVSERARLEEAEERRVERIAARLRVANEASRRGRRKGRGLGW